MWTVSKFVSTEAVSKLSSYFLQEMNVQLDTTVLLARRPPFLANLEHLRTQHLMRNVYLAHLVTTASQDLTLKTVLQVQGLKYSVWHTLSTLLNIKVQCQLISFEFFINLHKYFFTGFYCPEGTGHIWQACPTGSFSINTGLVNETECTPCTGKIALRTTQT